MANDWALGSYCPNCGKQVNYDGGRCVCGSGTAPKTQHLGNEMLATNPKKPVNNLNSYDPRRPIPVERATIKPFKRRK